mgnify:CR=1 FL=1
MKETSEINNSASNIISFKKYKDKKPDEVTSTIAAIIAIKIDHPSNTTPEEFFANQLDSICLLYTSPSPRDATLSRMPSSA